MSIAEVSSGVCVKAGMCSSCMEMIVTVKKTFTVLRVEIVHPFRECAIARAYIW